MVYYEDLLRVLDFTRHIIKGYFAALLCDKRADIKCAIPMIIIRAQDSRIARGRVKHLPDFREFNVLILLYIKRYRAADNGCCHRRAVYSAISSTHLCRIGCAGRDYIDVIAIV